MFAHYFLGIDQGTTGATSIVFDETWHIVGRGYCEIRQIYPRSGWVEHDAVDVLNAVKESVTQALSRAQISPESVFCIGVNHEGESVVAWDSRTGQPVSNAIVWQDRRTAKEADVLSRQYGQLILDKTGLRVDSYFSALKLRWILQNVPHTQALLRQGHLLAGNMDAWLLWNMTGGKSFATDASTASRTMLFNIHTQDWDDELLDLFSIPRSVLPPIRDSAFHFGYTDPDSCVGLRAALTGMMNDQQAALLGQGCIENGTVKTTYGTGCFMLMNTGDQISASANGLVPTVAWQIDGKLSYALDGGIYIAGAATNWLRDGLQIISSATETEALARSVPDSGGLLFVPAFTGLAAPYWDSYARGMMIGITGGTTRAHVVRATLEATAYQVCAVREAMERDSGISIPHMRCDGGGTANRFLMQFQSDLLGIPLAVPEVSDTTAMGAAFMAALGAGYFRSLSDTAAWWRCAEQYEPHMSADQREALLFQWERAVERAANWVSPCGDHRV